MEEKMLALVKPTRIFTATKDAKCVKEGTVKYAW